MPTRPPRYALVRYLQVEDAFTARIKGILERSAREVEADILRLGESGNPLTRAQLRAQQVAIKAHLRQDFTGDIQTAIRNGQKAAAEDAVKVLGEYEKEFLSAFGNADYYDDLIRAEAARASAGIDRIMARHVSSYKPLSERVYKAGQVANGAIDKAVDVALARGLSARDFAKSIRDLISPSVPGGASYAALRTARTEINNANHAANQQRYAESKLVDAVDWHLSTSHPEGDFCDDLVANSPYKVNEVPEKPHPQCLCYTTPSMPSRKEFLERLMRGDYGDEAWEGEVRQQINPRSDTLEVRRQAAFKDAAEKQRAAMDKLYDLRNKGLEPLKDAEYVKLFSEASKASDLSNRLAKEAAKQARISSAAIQPKIAKLPKSEPRRLADSLKGANPNGAGWNSSGAKSLDYSVNCTRVAATVEMRARGFNVTAAGTPNTARVIATKRDSYIKKNWVDPKTGSARNLKSTASEEALLKAMLKEPDGSRYFVVAPWKNGGAHIWNAEKINGEIIFFEGQTNTGLSPKALTANYLERMKFGGKGEYGVRFMRVDDLLPTDTMINSKWVIPE